MADDRTVQATSRLLAFLDNQPEPYILCDRQYRILAANTAYRSVFGAEAGLVGRTCYAVSHHFDAPCDQTGESCPLARSLVTGTRERIVHVHRTAQGETLVDIELTPIRDASGEIAWFVEKMMPVLTREASSAGELIGRSPAFLRMMELVARVAPSDAAVLLQGESGTGKELVARAIHHASRRANAPFVVVDCSGLPETLFESALFGHEKGSFTGATSRARGLVESADHGTIFLDEVGDIPLGLQVKLLRLLETSAYRPVGSTELRCVDVRLISATHRSLRQMVEAGAFRQDLFYRLSTFPITLPALRDRRSDIPLLADALLARLAPKRGLRFAAEARDYLMAYDYPGNVRELRNMLERATLLCDGDEIRLDHLVEDGYASGDAPTPPVAHDRLAALLRAGLSRSEIAAELGISERTLYRRLKSRSNKTRG